VATNAPLMHVDLTLRDEDGEKHTFAMPITWRAARRLAEIGISPNDVIGKGEGYELDQVGMARALHVGILEAGANEEVWTEDAVGEAMVRDGFLAFELPLGLWFGGFSTGGLPRKVRKKAAGPTKKKPGARGASSKTPTSSRSRPGASSRRSSGTSRSRSGGGSSTPTGRGQSRA